MVEIRLEPFAGTLADDLARKAPRGEARLWWLGQAGFAFRAGEFLGMIDPYLSDALGAKYAGTEKPHDRMMPSPIAPDAARSLGAVLCSHAHSDHMDPGSLGAIARNNPECRFVVPEPAVDVGVERGIPRERIRAARAGDSLDLAPGVALDIVASAHEDLKVSASGAHHYLGFVLRLGGVTVYHSGDCTPYEGQAETLKRFGIDLALLPVNGRDEARTRMGIIGNFTFDEAVDLCRRAGIPALIVHHFGMFLSNTVPIMDLERQIMDLGAPPRCFLPRVDRRVVLTAER